MRLLITGSTGFVGRNFLLEVLSQKSYTQIILPVRNPEKLTQQLKSEGLKQVPTCLQILRAEAPAWNFGKLTVDHLVHCAAVLYGRTKQDYFEANVEGTLRLMERIEGVKRAVLLSSLAAAGPCENGIEKDESANPSPITWYGESKLKMEEELARHHSHLNYVALRPPLILGPRDQASLPLFKMVRYPLRFKPGFKKKSYSFIAVEDLVQAILKVLWSEPSDTRPFPRHLFVAAKRPVGDVDLLKVASQIVGRPGVTVPVPQLLIKGLSTLVSLVPQWSRAIPSLAGDRASDIWAEHWVASPELFEKLYGWKAQRDLRTSLRETYEWYVKHGFL